MIFRVCRFGLLCAGLRCPTPTEPGRFSDRIGRPRSLILGSSGFCLATGCCFLASSVFVVERVAGLTGDGSGLTGDGLGLTGDGTGLTGDGLGLTGDGTGFWH